MPRLHEDEIESRLAELPGWDRHGDAIRRRFEGEDFAFAVALVNRIAPVAEELNHHPDLEVSWGSVTVTVTTHSQGGLTQADFELARRIDAVA
jgi:4a-hydroxytetrahydrobiopterin dehydratase